MILAIPTYDDWDSLALLLEQIDEALAGETRELRVLVIDDGSTLAPPLERIAVARRRIDSIELLTLRRNLGHQRAIATGLSWIDASLDASVDPVVVMDGDGEDSPRDIPRLLAALDANRGGAIVFAARLRRAEGLLFRFFYLLYRVVHRILTGIEVRVGNFSVIPREQLSRLVVVSDLWNHYAAAVFKARIPAILVPTARARRLSGKPKMNFTQLVVHGLSAISVFGDRVGVRLLIAVVVAAVVLLPAFSIVVLPSLMSQATFSWKLALASAGLAVLAINLLVAVMVFVLGLLGSRDNAAFLPARDHGWFVRSHTRLWTRGGTG